MTAALAPDLTLEPTSAFPPFAEPNTGMLSLAGSRMGYRRGEEIFGEGEDAGFCYRILSGTVRQYRILADGRRQVSAFLFAGDMFGLDADEQRRMSADAVTDCEVVATPRQVVFRHAEQSVEFAKMLWIKAARDLALAQDHMLLLGRQSAAERIMYFLSDLARRQGNRSVVELTMSRQDIADHLGLTIETVSRMLTTLEDRGAIELTAQRRITLRMNVGLRLHS